MCFELKDRKLERRVRRVFPFVFCRYNGDVIFNKYDFWHNGNAIVVVKLGGVLLRVVRDRGQEILEVGPLNASDYDWVDFVKAERLIALNKGISLPWPPDAMPSLSDLGPRLEAILDDLMIAFSSLHYVETKSQLSAIRYRV